jgi:hypothetical protein
MPVTERQKMEAIFVGLADLQALKSATENNDLLRVNQHFRRKSRAVQMRSLFLSLC